MACSDDMRHLNLDNSHFGGQSNEHGAYALHTVRKSHLLRRLALNMFFATSEFLYFQFCVNIMFETDCERSIRGDYTHERPVLHA